jgi:hypothetical protein
VKVWAQSCKEIKIEHIITLENDNASLAKATCLEPRAAQTNQNY